LTSVRKTRYSNYTVELIDCGSVDESVAFVRKHFRSVRIIQCRNLGFGEAYNEAIRSIQAKYIAVLNNDTEVLNPDWLMGLVAKIDDNHRLAAVACKMVEMSDPKILDSVGVMGIPFWRGFVDIGKSEPDIGQFGPSFEPFAFCGGAALIRKSAFMETGGFDSSLFLYVEDVELSWRLRLLGWRVGFCPEAIVAHFGGGTVGSELTPFKLYHSHKNLLRTIIKNCGSSLRRAICSYLVFSTLLVAGFVVLEPSKAIAVLKAIAWNLRELRATLRLRGSIQCKRVTGESEILRLMYPPLKRFQPPDHARVRTILDTIFARVK
jgi:hypothetical protein